MKIVNDKSIEYSGTFARKSLHLYWRIYFWHPLDSLRIQKSFELKLRGNFAPVFKFRGALLCIGVEIDINRVPQSTLD